ncbi:MAG: hypothetical protein WAN50_02885 [Minisyncoccia bacterium]
MNSQKISNWIPRFGNVLFRSALVLVVILVAIGWTAIRLNAPTPQTQTASTASFVYKPASTTPSESVASCAALKTSIQREIDRYNKSQQLTWSAGGATFDAGSYINKQKLSAIIYSPSVDTCIKVVEEQVLMQTPKDLTVYEDDYDFYDAFSGNLMDWLYTIKHGEPYESDKDLARKIAAYENATTTSDNPGNL